MVLETRGEKMGSTFEFEFSAPESTRANRHPAGAKMIHSKIQLVN